MDEPGSRLRQARPSRSSAGRRQGVVVAAARLGGTSGLVLALGLLTGPVQARALGATGRGQLAAVLVPLSLAPVLLDFGLQVFVARSRAQGTSARALLQTFLPLSLLLGLVGAAAAWPLARLFSQGRRETLLLIALGLLLSPVLVAMQTLQGIVWGEEGFRTMGRVRLLSALLPALGILALAGLGLLTVTTAALCFLGGSLLAFAPLLPTLTQYRWSRPDRQLARRGMAFGARAWLGTLSGVANGRLDQLLMAASLPASQLGYYAVAVVAASSPAPLVAAVGTVILPRAARDDSELVARSSRMSIALVTCISLALGATCPLLVPLLFGRGFAPAVPMVLLLLVGNPAGAAVAVQSGALVGAGRPELTTRVQLVCLVVTVVGLFVLLPLLAGTGAAIASTTAVWAAAIYLLRLCRTQFGLSTRELWCLRRSDLTAARASLSRRAVATA